MVHSDICAGLMAMEPETTVWSSKTAIVSTFARNIFGIFRDEAPYRLSNNSKKFDLE